MKMHMINITNNAININMLKEEANTNTNKMKEEDNRTQLYLLTKEMINNMTMITEATNHLIFPLTERLPETHTISQREDTSLLHL